MSVFARIDAFINKKDWTKDELREWLPELLAFYGQLRIIYERVAMPMGSNPDPALAKRLGGLQELFAKAEAAGVFYPEGEQWNWQPLPPDSSPRENGD